MKTGPLLRVLGLGVLVFGATWLAAVLYWRASGDEVTAGHLLGWLLVLPLLVFVVVLGVRAWLRRRRARREAGGNAGSGGDAAPGDVERVQDRPLYLHAAAAWTRAGSGPAAIAAALADPARPQLHATLRDSMGLPVFAAEVEGVDPDWMAGLLAPGPGERPAVAAPVHALRALALLDPVAEDLLVAAQALSVAPVQSPAAAPAPGEGLHPHARHHSRSAQAPDGLAPVPPTRVHLLLPATWPPSLRDAATTRIAAIARSIGLGTDRLAIEARVAGTTGEVWRALERIAAPAAGPAAPHLLLATGSMLDQHVVEHLEAHDQLLVSGHLEGRIPGEAAAGLLLASGPVPMVGNAPPVRLHGACRGAAGRGRAAAAGSAGLLQDAIALAALEAGPAVVFTDADHRPSRAVEAAGAITTALPETEPAEAARHLGLACGDTGLATPLVLLAAAAAHVREAGTPALVLDLAGDAERVARALSPLPESTGPVDPADAAPSNATPAAAEAAIA